MIDRDKLTPEQREALIQYQNDWATRLCGFRDQDEESSVELEAYVVENDLDRTAPQADAA